MDGRATRIFVISLATAEARRQRFTERARSARVPWEFFDGYTSLHPALSYEPEAALVGGGRALTSSELGCYSSHYATWLQLLSDPAADRYIILEDDTIPNWTLMERIVKSAPEEIGADLLRFYFTRIPPVREVKRGFLGASYAIVELLDIAWGAVGYMINKRAAEKLVRHLQTVLRPVDIAMEAAWLHGVPNYAVFPFPVMEEGESSTISDDRYAAAPKPLPLKLRRAVARLAEGGRKSVWRVRRRLAR